MLLQFDNSALEPDRHRMRAVVRPQLREDIRHVPFDGVLGEFELRGDLLIRRCPPRSAGARPISRSDNSSSPVCSASCGGNVRWDAFLPRMYRTDGRQQFFIDVSLEQISARARLQSADYLHVAGIRR